MSSSRLPGKVLMPLVGMPMLFRQIERIRQSKLIDKLIVATTIDESDDIVASLCKENGVLFYRGSVENVLERYYTIAKLYEPDNIIRLTGDCPLMDPDIIDRVVQCHLTNKNDFTSNVITPTYPDGLDIEVFTMETLEKMYHDAKRPSLKEHVTLYVHENPTKFKMQNVEHIENLSQLRWTVDEIEDYEFVYRVYQGLYQLNPFFTFYDILNFLNENPEIQKINGAFLRNEGLKKSLEKEFGK